MCRSTFSAIFPLSARLIPAVALGVGSLLLAAGGGGAPTFPSTIGATPMAMAAVDEDSQTLREGDEIKLTFPGAPTLDTTQKIRRDGRIALPLVGEVQAAGRNPVELERQLTELFSQELVTGDVYVSVVASSYPVFVTGAVVRPGKIEADRPMTALEAIMEAGGFQLAKANSQAVVVVRQEPGGVKNYTLNLQKTLQGAPEEPFYLRPSDIIYVPERFAWF
jgi:polysaccharide biosynthesis/export protein